MQDRVDIIMFREDAKLWSYSTWRMGEQVQFYNGKDRTNSLDREPPHRHQETSLEGRIDVITFRIVLSFKVTFIIVMQ